MCYDTFLKRIFDLLISSTSILLLSPLIMLLALWIKLDSKGSVLFIQPRLGHKGRIFKIYKFRTMKQRERQSTQQIFPDHPEVTTAGRFLRRFKLDEIPQLLNVLKGEMSLIGPRPCLPELAQKFDENGKKRIKVRPGLFGLADIKGGYYLSWPQRWVYDRYYVEHLNPWLDLKLIFMAIPIILFDEDYYLKKKKSNNP
ncbi:MAG: sugar transferase [Bacteroidales bacterium]|nr:sugar transferase [Bacteroidales bacterium]